jgi:molybdopterin-guanine dinucleotide biosynthesis protein A
LSDLAGIFVGGSAKRLGGIPKGLLPSPEGPTLVERTGAICRSLGFRVVLVGAAEPYVHLGLEVIADLPPGIGPLGGLVALLRHAGCSRALALGCDMPFVSRALLERLIVTERDAAVLAPRRDGRWEPLCARYDAARVLPVAARRTRSANHSLQGVLDEAGASELALSPEEGKELRDWDTREDVRAALS